MKQVYLLIQNSSYQIKFILNFRGKTFYINDYNLNSTVLYVYNDVCDSLIL